ncbi:MAG: Tat pathway signal protein [Betaproteobacteria bacterium HGW-Betaproteobacteria-13]|jgi:hypothetical protein|nr:MAG: Tat pathway signal protein [Betaproteobacteria bacterium HGW-Betaproteobacteria-13]
MLTRRRFLTTSVTACGLLGLQACSGETDYAEAVARIWRHSATTLDDAAARTLELVRYATLAPSSHNTQCWKFRPGGDGISILPDFDRRCPVVDPDDHHLFVSLGCAAENLIQAAAAFGQHGEARFVSAAGGSVDIALTPATAQRSPLFEAIPNRQTTRGDFDGQPLDREELGLLAQAGRGEGVQLLLLTERQAMEAMLELVIQGNTAQMRDPAFIRELKTWIRFGEAEAVALGDGLFARSSGNPALPRWLGSRMFDLFFSEQVENDKYARQVRNSAGIAVFVSAVNDAAHWMAVGRAFERFALQATALGVRTAHLNQPVELPGLRAQVSDYLGLKPGRPDLVIRFGRGAEMPRALRRPVAAVIA